MVRLVIPAEGIVAGWSSRSVMRRLYQVPSNWSRRCNLPEAATPVRRHLVQQVRDAPAVPSAFELESPLHEGYIGARFDFVERFGFDGCVTRGAGLHQRRVISNRVAHVDQYIPEPVIRALA